MTRTLLCAALFAATLLTGTALAAPDESPVAGRWKFRITQGEETITFLFAFSQSDGKWVGDFLGSSAKLKAEPTVERLDVTADKVRFAVLFGGREFINFDGALAKDGKKLSGSFNQFGGPLQLTEMYPSKLKKADDPVELAREALQQLDAGPALFDAGFAVLSQAAAKKLTADEVRQVVDKLAKASAGYGSRWDNATGLKIAGVLADQDGYSEIALTQIRRAERTLSDDAPVAQQMEVFDTLARVLTKAGKPDEAKKYAASVAKLEARDFAESTKETRTFKAEPFAGRKGKSDRVAVIEVFTGAECPPCVAVDVACDALLACYKPTELIVLNYHFHVPAPDPLTSFDGMDRAGFYAEQITGAPSVFFNGKAGPKGGGPIAAGKAKFAEFRAELDKQLETPAAAKLTLSVTPGDKGLTAKATAEVDAPGEKVMLRFAVVEERVRYRGGNGVRYHSAVVREMPGTAKGQPLTKKTQDVTATIDVAELRGKLSKYLDDYAKTEGEFPRPDRPLALTNLKLVAFVQNDATGEILQAVQVNLDAAK